MKLICDLILLVLNLYLAFFYGKEVLDYINSIYWYYDGLRFVVPILVSIVCSLILVIKLITNKDKRGFEFLIVYSIASNIGFIFGLDVQIFTGLLIAISILGILLYTLLLSNE